MARRPARPELANRSRDILETVVRLHIETGRPVSSGLVERSVRRRVSAATIRTVMKSLEQEGYLAQLHTSSGRMPTDAGFRVYVDGLRAGWELRRHDVPVSMRRLVTRSLGDAAGGPAGMGAVARLLSRLTDNVSIILGPTWDTLTVSRIEVHRQGPRLVLVVMILDNAQVRTCLLDLREEWPPAVVREAARLLDRRAAGVAVAEIRDGALEAPDLVASPTTRCAAELARCGREVTADPTDGEVELEGLANVLDEPEFHDPEPLKELLRFVESPRLIRRALGRLDRQSGGQVGVWIGDENPVGGLKRFAVLTRGLELDGRHGVLAVLGPRRMGYQRAFHGMDILGRALEDNPGRLAC